MSAVATTLRRVAGIARIAFTPLAIAFLLLAAYGARDVLKQNLVDARGTALAAAAVFWAATHLIAPLFAWLVLRAQGIDIGYARALAIHVGRLPARYLPGGIWHTVSRIADYSAAGATRAQITRFVVLENAVPVALAATLGGGGMLLLGRATVPALLASCVGLVALSVIPLVLRSRRLQGDARFPLSAYGVSIAVMAAFWTIAALAFCSYWTALPRVSAESVPLIGVASAYLLSWAAGFVAIFAPQGLGVFEISIAALLRGDVAGPLVDTAVLVAGFRAVLLVADMSTYLILLATRAVGRIAQTRRR